MNTFSVNTQGKNEVVDITQHVRQATTIKNGFCIVYCPHTTCGVFVNENYDPTVKEDIINTLQRLVPEDGEYKHTEGNSDAHIKAALMGNSRVVLVKDGKLALGRWEGIFLFEGDGPRQRSVFVMEAENGM